MSGDTEAVLQNFKVIILKELYRLSQPGELPSIAGGGVCYAIACKHLRFIARSAWVGMSVARLHRDELQEGTVWNQMTESWPYFSGSHAYPTPDPSGVVSSKEIYQETNNKWAGEYGDLRRDFCLHCFNWYSKRWEIEI